MTAPERSASGLDANARGILVLVVAVLVGLVLLFKVGDGGSSADAGDAVSPPGSTAPIGADATTTTAGSGTTDTSGEATTTTEAGSTGVARPAGEVKVVVFNGTDIDFAAKTVSESIGATGYVMGRPGSPVEQNPSATIVYYAEGYEADAEAIVSVIGKGGIQAKPAEALGPGSDDANIVVVLGATDTVAGT